MAACSSGNSSLLVLRITYDELVAYADELDKKEEKKNYKKKNQENFEENGSKPAKKLNREDSTDVSKNTSLKKDEAQCKESNFTHDRDEEKKARKESKKEKKKLSGPKANRKSSCYGEDNVNDSDKVTVSNGDKMNVAKEFGKHGGKSKKETKGAKDEEDEENNFELDLRARTGGVLKLSKGPVHHDTEESPKDTKPRGIIKLPDGFDFNGPDRSEEKDPYKTDKSSKERAITRKSSSNKQHDQDYPENQGLQCKEVRFSRENEEERKENCRADEKTETGTIQSKEDCEECVDNQNSVQENEQGSDSQTKVEKKLKSLHHQKAQKLMRAVAQKEMMLSNLLSRDILDKGAFEKICTLSKEIQEVYKGIIMLDVGFAVQQDVDQYLWKNAFYKVIETFRKYGKLFLGYAGKTEVLSQEEINNCLKKFLEDAETFYKGLLEFLQKAHELSVQDAVNQPRKAENLGKNARLALLSSHHILICLGDIERYQGQFQPNQNWASIRSWYLKASKLAPKNGKPYNQLGVIAVLANRKLDSVYFYMRSLAASNPILTAREKLMDIFHDIQKKADRIQRAEDERKANSEREIHRMEGDNHKGRGKGRSVFGQVAKGLGFISEHKATHGRYEVWIFMHHGAYRRVVLTDHGKVQEVNSAGDPVSESKNEEHPTDQAVKESPKISLQEVNKKFVLHFLCAHGLLYSRIGMERLPTLQYQLIGELHTLLEYPSSSAISKSNLLQMMTISMFAIDNTAAQDVTEQYVRVGTPQDQAMSLAVEMFTLLLKACCTLLQATDLEVKNSCEGLSAPLRQFLPAIKVFADWLVCHVDLWQVSSISTHRNLWESVSQFTNAIAYVDIDNVQDEDGSQPYSRPVRHALGDEIVTLWEDEFLAGFKPLNKATRPMCKVSDVQLKNLAEDYLRCQCLKDFAAFLVSLENPPLEFDDEKGMFSAMIKSTPVSPIKESTDSVIVHLDTSQHDEHEESDDEDDVIIESEEEELDSGDEVEKDVKELKAKKDALKKQVEDHKEREDKAKAVIEEHISKPRLMFENYPTYLVPDTNCFVDHLDGLRAIVACQAFTLIVPLIVINELDGLKKDFQPYKYNNLQHAQYVLDNARSAIDFLENEFSQRNPQVKTVTSKGTELDTIAFRSEDPSGRKGKNCNDDIILSCCLHYCEENFVNRLATENKPITIQRKVVLMTDDRNLRVKAYTRNVPVLTVPQFRKMARL